MPILGSRGAGAASAFGFTSGGLALDVDYLLVAGGGGGGQTPGGGGGGGGFRTSFPGGTKVTLTEAVTTITVGAGGAGSAPGVSPSLATNRGENSDIGGIISSSGGGLGSNANPGNFPDIADDPTSGGSSGGTPHRGDAVGQANVGGYSPPEGNVGAASGDSNFQGSGGGGAGGVGQSASGGANGPRGNGGSGSSTSITGSAVTHAGGGGGGGYQSAPGGSGGSGGGGNGTNPQSGTGQPGTPALGGGGGGAGYQPGGNAPGGSGGSGKVVIRIPAADAPGTLAVAPGTNSLATDGPTGDKIASFTVDGTLTL